MPFGHIIPKARPSLPAVRSTAGSREHPAYWLATYEVAKPRLGVVRMGSLLRAAKQQLSADGWQQVLHELSHRIYGAGNAERPRQLSESQAQDMTRIADRYLRALNLYTLKPDPYLRVMVQRRPPGTRTVVKQSSLSNGRIWCPLCCSYYLRKHTTKEHVPPHCLGGIRRIRVCHHCNELTGIYDNYTVQTIRAASGPANCAISISLRPLTTNDIVSVSDTGHQLTVDIDPEPKWQATTTSKRTVDKLLDHNKRLLLLTPGSGQALGLPVPNGSPFIVRIDSLDYVTSYVKAAYLLVVLLLGRLGPSYARWCDAIRSLLAGSSRYSGEPKTAGSDAGRYVPVIENPWPDKTNKIGFSLSHRLWLVIVRNRLVVLPSYDPFHSCQEALFLLMQYFPLNRIPYRDHLAALSKPEHTIWFDYPRSYNNKNVQYVGAPAAKGYPFGRRGDLIGSIVRVPRPRSTRGSFHRSGAEYGYYAVIHQRGRSLAVAEVKKDTWKDFCFDWARAPIGHRDFDRPYPTELGQWYPDSVVQNRLFPVRQHYQYCMIL